MTTTRFSDTVNYRIKELMTRDPLVERFLKEYQQSIIQNPEKMQQTGIMDMTDQLFSLGTELRSKWGLWCFEYDPNGNFYVQKISEKVTEHRPVEMFSDFTVPDTIRKRHCDIFPAMPDHVYLDVDLSTLDMHDEKRVKSEMWQIVKTSLLLRQKALEGMKQAQPQDDPPELGFVYHIREPVFENYLRWYDLHIKEYLGFRLIAFLENVRKENLLTYDEWLEKLRSMKWKVGRPIRGEDRVEKAVKIIWEAIHKSSYTKPEAIMDEWSCPTHGNDYHDECKSCRALSDKFNKIYPPELYMEPMDPGTLELISSPYPQRKRKKPDQE